jgi:hypothetical protein
MIGEWILEGAAFGIKAFMAVMVFLLCFSGIAGVVALIAGAFGGLDQ